MEKCKLTLRYLAEVAIKIENSILFDQHLGRLRYLQDLAERAGNGRQRVTLRGFMCVEIMATRAYSRTMLIGTYPTDMRDWPRSAFGLKKLLKIVRAENDDCTAALVEYKLDSNAGRNADQIIASTNERKANCLGATEAAAMILRHSLLRVSSRSRSWAVTLPTLGSLLHQAVSLFDVTEQLNIADELLQLTEESSRRAWEPLTQSEM